MNSSIKPPENIKKFQFDVDFELEDERLRLEMLRQAELQRQVELNAPAPLIYNETDIEAAKHEAFQRGQAQGMEDAKAAIETVLVSLVERTLQGAQILLQNESQREQLMLETALRTTMTTIKKFWPQILQTNALEVLEKTLRETIANNPDETRMVLRVHDSLLDEVVKRLPQIKEQEAFNGKLIVIADETIHPGDCKIEWADGGLERLGNSLSQRLDDAMTRLIATLNANPNSNSERMSS